MDWTKDDDGEAQSYILRVGLFVFILREDPDDENVWELSNGAFRNEATYMSWTIGSSDLEEAQEASINIIRDAFREALEALEEPEEPRVIVNGPSVWERLRQSS